MRFGPLPLARAEGAILAHSCLIDGRRMAKGRRLDAADIARLAAAGIATVEAAQLDAQDVHEDAAAAELSVAARGAGLDLTSAFTGRANLIADAAGVLLYDPARLFAVNGVDEAITIAALPPFASMQKKQLAATVKIIPFATRREMLDRACALAAAAGGEGGDAAPLFRLAPFRPKRVLLVQTDGRQTKSTVLDKTRQVMERRLVALGSRIVAEQRCAHEKAALGAILAAASGDGVELILIVGATAIVDRGDVIPAALVHVGGEVERFGLPVDPGNLLLLGRIGAVPVIGAPGCARSPKANGFDWILARLCADLAISDADVIGMAAGGLLKEIPERPQPRRKPAVRRRGKAKIAALLLAAGQSRRMGRANKLLHPVDGEPMVARVAARLIEAGLQPVYAVTGHEGGKVAAALASHDVSMVANPAYGGGMATSLKAGIAALPEDVDGVLIALGDMPRVSAGAIRRLVAAFSAAAGPVICVPVFAGKRGNPVLFSADFLHRMRTLDGDEGARRLLAEHADLVQEVAMQDDGVLIDIDTPADFPQPPG